MKPSKIRRFLSTQEGAVTAWTPQLTKWVVALTISGWLVWSEWGWQSKAIVGALGIAALLCLVLLTKYSKWRCQAEEYQKQLTNERTKGPQPLHLDHLTFRVLQTIARKRFVDVDELTSSFEEEKEKVERSLEILSWFRLIDIRNGKATYGQLLARPEPEMPNKTME